MSERFALMLIATLTERINSYERGHPIRGALVEYREAIRSVMKAMGHTLDES